ncbi:unnamed protein product, partial [Rotaria magnacalcarata]
MEIPKMINPFEILSISTNSSHSTIKRAFKQKIRSSSRSGCQTNETQGDGSTALHAAAFYGHQSIVELLLEYEANPEIRNSFGNNPKDEACSREIRDCILSKTDDKINSCLNKLKTDELAKNLIVLKYADKII